MHRLLQLQLAMLLTKPYNFRTTEREVGNNLALVTLVMAQQ